MSTIDQIALRGYQSAVAQHQKTADLAADYIGDKIRNIKNESDVTTALSDARNLAGDLAELILALSALKALQDVEFLTDVAVADRCHCCGELNREGDQHA